MEEEGWHKDETLYLVFACSQCHQYMYVKAIKKNKKCLRCGRSHTVSRVKESGEIVLGMTAAVDHVKQKQHGFALKELNRAPGFETTNGFQIHQPPSKIISNLQEKPIDSFSERFKDLLLDISSQHNEFPFYLIEIGAEKYGIPSSELKLLTKSFLKKEILIHSSTGNLKVNLLLLP